MTQRIDPLLWQRHAWMNRLQTAVLVVVLATLLATVGWLLWGNDGILYMLVFCAVSLVLQPFAGPELVLRLYRAQPIAPGEAPELHTLVERLAARANLPRVPRLYFVDTPIVNAFSVGSRNDAAIALTSGLLARLDPRQITGVLAHEVAHIAHGDVRVMSLADSLTRMTSVLSLTGQILLLVNLPLLLVGAAVVNWLAVALLVFAPQIAMLVQLGLSRVREYDADLAAVALTGDPEGLASALMAIERAHRGWRAWLFPGWGSPEPSWLRTHPATEDRVRRLLELARRAPPSEQDHDDTPPFIASSSSGRTPRYRPGSGLWY